MPTAAVKFSYRKGARWKRDHEYEWKILHQSAEIGSVYWTAERPAEWDVIDLAGKTIGQRRTRQAGGELLLEHAAAKAPARPRARKPRGGNAA